MGRPGVEAHLLVRLAVSVLSNGARGRVACPAGLILEREDSTVMNGFCDGCHALV